MSMDDSMSDWGIAFISTIDEKVQQPGNEEVLRYWANGDFDECYDWLKKTYPELTEEQFEWIEGFLSEI